MGKMNNRSKFDILFDVLDCVDESGPISRTRLEGKIGFTYRAMRKHLELLTSCKCIQMIKKQHGPQTYTSCNITQKGRELKEKLQKIYDFFGGEKPAW